MKVGREKLSKIIKYTIEGLTATAALCGIAGFFIAFIYPDTFDEMMGVIRGGNSEIVEEISQSTEKLESSLGDVQKSTEGSKRETSNDPIKELVNLGYSYDGGAFWKAARMGDINAVKLFCKAGSRPVLEYPALYFRSMEPDRSGVSAEIWAVIETCPIVDRSELCEKGFQDGVYYATQFDWAEYQRMCGDDALKSAEIAFQGQVKKQEAELIKLCKQYAESSFGATVASRLYQDQWLWLKAPVKERLGEGYSDIANACAAVSKWKDF